MPRGLAAGALRVPWFPSQHLLTQLAAPVTSGPAANFLVAKGSGICRNANAPWTGRKNILELSTQGWVESGSAGQLFHSGMFLCPRSRRVPPALSSPGVNSGADQGSCGPPSNWVRVPARVPSPAWASGPPACVDRAPLKGEGPRGLTSVRCNGLH